MTYEYIEKQIQEHMKRELEIAKRITPFFANTLTAAIDYISVGIDMIAVMDKSDDEKIEALSMLNNTIDRMIKLYPVTTLTFDEDEWVENFDEKMPKDFTFYNKTGQVTITATSIERNIRDNRIYRLNHDMNLIHNFSAVTFRNIEDRNAPPIYTQISARFINYDSYKETGHSAALGQHIIDCTVDENNRLCINSNIDLFNQDIFGSTLPHNYPMDIIQADGV